MNEGTETLRAKLPPHGQVPSHARSRLQRAEIIDDMLRPRLTFHGTSFQNIPLIVRHGFKLPGQPIIDGKVVASPRTGIVYRGRGIYSSQAAFYALAFAPRPRESLQTPLGTLPSMRLIVCATLMGRTSRSPGVLRPHALNAGYDVDFQHDFEYIVFDGSAILPCYVIHLDLGADVAKRAVAAAQRDPVHFERDHRDRDRPKDNPQYLAPGDLQRQKDMRKAAAMKHFPKGFGPAKGTNFVIEEIGEIDDDEEDFGAYQEDKYAESRPPDSLPQYYKEEYQEARRE